MSENQEELKEEQASNQQEQPETQENPNSDTSTQKEKEHEYGEAEMDNKIKLLEGDLIEERNKYLRLYAEFENFRKRTAKERLENISSASGDLMKEILPVVDDFERAIQSNKDVGDAASLKKGFELLYNKLYKVLTAKGLTPIKATGDNFDPEKHEAIAQIPAEKKKDKGKVIDVVEKGYTLNDKILRHPKVVVGT